MMPLPCQVENLRVTEPSLRPGSEAGSTWFPPGRAPREYGQLEQGGMGVFIGIRWVWFESKMEWRERGGRRRGKQCVSGRDIGIQRYGYKDG
eukprot:754431-Hanusia_phi.AAC.1